MVECDARRCPTCPPAATPEPGRDGRGRFAKGNPGGPGNPFARRVAALRSLVLEMVSYDDLREVAQALIEQARQGDLVAVRLLFQYLLGKPSAPIDPDRLEIDEMSIFAQEAFTAQQLTLLIHGISAPVTMAALRGVIPILGKEHIAQLKKLLAAPRLPRPSRPSARLRRCPFPPSRSSAAWRPPSRVSSRPPSPNPAKRYSVVPMPGHHPAPLATQATHPRRFLTFRLTIQTRRLKFSLSLSEVQEGMLRHAAGPARRD